MQLQAHAVHQRDQAQPQEVVQQLVLVGSAAQPPAQARERHAGQHADADTAQGAPQHIDQHPADAALTQVVQAEQAQTQHHKRKRGAVVHASLAGEREAQAIAVTGVAALHVGRQHRVGRGHDGTEQNAGAQRQAEHIKRERRHQRHRERHRHRGQHQRRSPGRKRKGHWHLHAGREQRDQHRHLGQHLQQRRFLQRVETERVHPRGSEQQAHAQIQHGRGDGHALEHSGGHAHHQQHGSHQHEPLGVAHRSGSALRLSVRAGQSGR